MSFTVALVSEPHKELSDLAKNCRYWIRFIDGNLLCYFAFSYRICECLTKDRPLIVDAVVVVPIYCRFKTLFAGKICAYCVDLFFFVFKVVTSHGAWRFWLRQCLMRPRHRYTSFQPTGLSGMRSIPSQMRANVFIYIFSRTQLKLLSKFL